MMVMQERVIVALTGACLLCSGLLAARPAQAAFGFIFSESGGSVVGTGSGSLQLDPLQFVETLSAGAPGLNPSSGSFLGGDGTGELALYMGDVGASGFGPGPASPVPTTTGAGLGIVPFAPGFFYLAVPATYVSGTPLTATMTFPGATFASLGITPGAYAWHWSSGPGATDFLLLQFGTDASAVPGPSSAPLLAAGLLGLSAAARRRRLPPA
ncbi:hypothetical protein [Roseomonas sp. AR75]|uniref:hypothetical protein n=1 Tax=Roseomonas sp. AR75 TaxID=2562311 RepID=UPI0010C0970E|nr:hypothetical protein [Roseomonas sp. AR75]